MVVILRIMPLCDRAFCLVSENEGKLVGWKREKEIEGKEREYVSILIGYNVNVSPV